VHLFSENGVARVSCRKHKYSYDTVKFGVSNKVLTGANALHIRKRDGRRSVFTLQWTELRRLGSKSSELSFNYWKNSLVHSVFFGLNHHSKSRRYPFGAEFVIPAAKQIF